jgi:hypothetical protein
MPMLIKNTDQYLYEKKRDILVLEMRSKGNKQTIIDRELCEEQAKEHLDWFKNQGIESYMTCSPGLLMGWLGHYYIDIDSTDKVISEYSLLFETPTGKSLEPEKYQMILISYDEWVSDGSLARHEQYLIDREDPNWEP